MSNSRIRKAALAVILGGMFVGGASVAQAAGMPVHPQVPAKDLKLDADRKSVV